MVEQVRRGHKNKWTYDNTPTTDGWCSITVDGVILRFHTLEEWIAYKNRKNVRNVKVREDAERDRVLASVQRMIDVPTHRRNPNRAS